MVESNAFEELEDGQRLPARRLASDREGLGDLHFGRGTCEGSSPPPLVLSAGLSAMEIAASYFHTCALTSAGGVKCWGGNDWGQLGVGTTTDRHAPVAVSGLASGVAASNPPRPPGRRR